MSRRALFAAQPLLACIQTHRPLPLTAALLALLLAIAPTHAAEQATAPAAAPVATPVVTTPAAQPAADTSTPASSNARLAVPATALDRYLAQADPTYGWSVVKTVPGQGSTTFVVDLRSQSWRTEKEVDRTVWQHWLIIVKPDQLRSDTAFLYISGGNNRDAAPDGAGDLIAGIAQATGAVTAELRMVPNQPLTFFQDGRKRVEDDLIAYTWDKFMTTGDETWPARLPMVKSAHRAMDTITALLASDQGGKQLVNRFVVAGGSKRGWTTWLTGATDARVVAIAPAVIDVVNVRISMRHHYEAYGFWAPAVGNYVQHKIVNRESTPEYAALLAIEDPYAYRDRLTMPKYIVNAAGDEFFLPDSSQFYFDDLPGEKLIRYAANTKHSLSGSDAREGIAAFFEAVISGRPRPRLSWELLPDGAIRAVSQDSPKQVQLWQATNPKARDFRLDKIGKAYQAKDLQAEPDGSYIGRVETPSEGWTAFFIEFTYDLGGPLPLKLTTQVRVLPDTLPFAGKLDAQSK